jgi:hypothetical protein
MKPTAAVGYECRIGDVFRINEDAYSLSHNVSIFLRDRLVCLLICIILLFINS